MLEPSNSEEALYFTKKAFEISENFDTPVLLKMCTRVSHSQSLVETGKRLELAPKAYVKNAAKYVMAPANAKKRHPFVEERTKKLAEFAETSDLNRLEMASATDSLNLGIITSSTCYQYAKEVFGNRASILKLGMVWPLPEKLIRDFATKVDRLVVIEELDPIIESLVKALGIKVEGKNLFPLVGEFSQSLIAEKLGKDYGITKGEGCKSIEDLPVRPPVMCSGCPHRGLFYTLSKQKCTVMGDIGCYTLGNSAPLDMCDTCLCMGADITMAQGFFHNEKDRHTFSFIGDSTFFASGITGVVNAVYNQSKQVICILDNSTTAMTGHQPHPGTGRTMMGDIVEKISIEKILTAIGVSPVLTVDPFDTASAVAAVKEADAASGTSAIIFKSPCISIASKVGYKFPKEKEIQRESCIGCRKCINELGCPAISISTEDKKPLIDKSLCTGCSLCAQVCPVKAII